MSASSPGTPAPRPIDVHSYLLWRPDDVGDLRADIAAGRVDPDTVRAVTGKTAGAGGPADTSRGAIDAAIRSLLRETGSRSDDEIAAIPMNFSGGAGGVIAPCFTVYSEDASGSAPSGGALVLGSGLSSPIPPEHIGRVPMVEAVADAVRAAAEDAGLDLPQVRYVMTKNPMLTDALVAEARARGKTTIPHEGLAGLFPTSGAAALGAAYALGDVALPSDSQIGVDHELWSSRSSASSGIESDRAQVIAFGNRGDATGRFRVGHATMSDALDVAALHRAARDAGLEVADHADPRTFADRIAALYVKANSTIDGRLRGAPQVQSGYRDPAYTSQLKSSVGGMFAAALGRPAFYISAAGVHQGPPGGGSVVVVARVD